MQFSVIVPVYNIEAWLDSCVKSILGQTYQDYELILVDDGSTDTSGKLCDAYLERDSRVRTFHKINGGLSDARNYGIARARGAYLVFVDGDDYIAEDALELLAREIQKNQADVILSEGTYIVKGTNVKLDKKFDKKSFCGISGSEAFLRTSGITPNWSAWGKCYRTQFWRDHAFEFVKGRLSEDFQLIDRVLLEADCVSMVSAFYFYQYRSESIVHSIKAKNLEDLLLSMQEWKRYLSKANLDRKIVDQMISLQAGLLCHSILGYISLINSKEQDRLMTKAQEYMEYLPYGGSGECRVIWIFYKVFGMKNTCKLLGFIKKRKLQRGA